MRLPTIYWSRMIPSVLLVLLLVCRCFCGSSSSNILVVTPEDLETNQTAAFNSTQQPTTVFVSTASPIEASVGGDFNQTNSSSSDSAASSPTTIVVLVKVNATTSSLDHNETVANNMTTTFTTSLVASNSTLNGSNSSSASIGLVAPPARQPVKLVNVPNSSSPNFLAAPLVVFNLIWILATFTFI